MSLLRFWVAQKRRPETRGTDLRPRCWSSEIYLPQENRSRGVQVVRGVQPNTQPLCPPHRGSGTGSGVHFLSPLKSVRNPLRPGQCTQLRLNRRVVESLGLDAGNRASVFLFVKWEEFPAVNSCWNHPL